MHKLSAFIISTVLSATSAYAGQMSATVNSADEPTKSFGEVMFADTPHGLLITPHLTGLAPGLHGLHLHQHPDCGDMGMDAGDHFDPQNTQTHQGPYGNGHLGDLPVLYVSNDGQANTPVIAPRLKTSDLQGLAIMIHAGGDNYSDTPKLGGGGARIGCGVVK